MKKEFYHGSPTKIDGPIKKGTCVSSARHNSVFFALRRRQGDCYLYVMVLDHTTDLEQSVDSAGVVDYVLARDTQFSKCILLTDEILAEIRAEGVAEVSRLFGD